MTVQVFFDQIPIVAVVVFCVWVGAAFRKETSVLLGALILAHVAPTPWAAVVVWGLVMPAVLPGIKFVRGWFDAR